MEASSASEILRYVRETDVSMVQKYIYLMGLPTSTPEAGKAEA